MDLADSQVVVQTQEVVTGLYRFIDSVAYGFAQLLLQTADEFLVVQDQAPEAQHLVLFELPIVE